MQAKVAMSTFYLDCQNHVLWAWSELIGYAWIIHTEYWSIGVLEC